MPLTPLLLIGISAKNLIFVKEPYWLQSSPKHDWRSFGQKRASG